MFRHLQDIDRRVIYLLLLLALGAPLLLRYSVKPARMASAERLFKVVEETKFGPNDIAFIAMDLGPSTKAENGPQAEVIIEHLMRRRIKFAVFSIYYQSEPFLESIPMGVAERLMKEMVGQVWEYGKDWVNLGYRPGADSLIQGIPKSKNLAELFAE
ncbi:MAG: hypothetical protein GX589_04055, partial [Deltaproteobacteria bacterium]|nr:hypothetical protein [Deltaproteobacteria bacterium]